MGKVRTLYILIGILFVASAVTWGISRHEEYKEQIKNSDEIILSIDSETVTALSWETEENSLAFHKDGKWFYDEDENFPVDEDKIANLLEQFQEFGVSFVIEEVEDYSQYGLDTPVCTITITTDEETYTVALGTYSTMDSKRYVSIGDGKVYLVEHDPLDDYEVGISDMIRNDEIPDLSQAQKLQFSGAEDYEIVYEEENSNTDCADDVYFTEDKPLDTTVVKSYLRSISGLQFEEYVSYNVTEEELQEYGLDKPELTINIEYLEESGDTEEEPATASFTMSIGRNEEEVKQAEEKAQDTQTEEEEGTENESEDISAYVRIGDSQIIYRISGQDYDNLMAASYNDLRHKEVFTAAFEDVTQIDISLEGQDYTIICEEQDEEQLWYYQEEELDISNIRSAIRALQVTETEDFVEETPTQKEEIQVTVHLNRDKQIQIALYRYDGEYCLAVVNGNTVSKIPRSCVVDLVEAVNAVVLN